MEREEILRIATESGACSFIDCYENNGGDIEHILAFANAIAAHEREQMLKSIDGELCGWGMGSFSRSQVMSAIRSRGNKQD